jgi:feruloyl-CoA synthase
VIAGHDRAFVSALLFPSLAACRRLAADLEAETPARTLLDDPRVSGKFREILQAVAQESTGSTTFVARAVLLDAPPSIDAGELTDKGSVSQRAVLESRASQVEALYADPPAPNVIVIEAGA